MDKPEIIFTLPFALGGVSSFNFNIINNSNSNATTERMSGALSKVIRSLLPKRSRCWMADISCFR